MTRNMKQLVIVTVAALATLSLAMPAYAATGSANPGTWPNDWTNASSWDNGVPGGGVHTLIGRAQNNSTAVPGVILNLSSAAGSIGQLEMRENSVFNINAGGVLSTGNFFSKETSTLNVSGQLTVPLFLGQGTSSWNFLPGAVIQSTGPVRIAQGAGQNVLVTMTGGVYNAASSDFKIGEGGGTGTINQSAGLVKVNGVMDFHNTLSDPGSWNISGGQLKINGALMQTNGAAGGIFLSGTGELYVAGDQTANMTLIDGSGDALLSGATQASFGNWVLSDSTQLTDYTKFTATVPEPSSFVLAGLGLVGLGWFGLRRRRKG